MGGEAARMGVLPATPGAPLDRAVFPPPIRLAPRATFPRKGEGIAFYCTDWRGWFEAAAAGAAGW